MSEKAKKFFDYGRASAATGNYEYAISMFIDGLALAPDMVEAHQELRDISLKRKASGGKAMGMKDKWGLKKGDDRQNMLNAEKLLAYDPGETDYMVTMLQSAVKAGLHDAALWIGPILRKANGDLPKPEFAKFIILKDAYKAIGAWQLATEACQQAVDMRPNDMDLLTEMKHLGAYDTIKKGNYGTAGDFRGSIKDMDAQQRLIDADKDIRTDDAMSRIIKDAESEWQSDPEERGKLMRYVEALVKSENRENEDRAIEVLQSAFDRTKQFSFRLNITRVKMRQWAREERAKRTKINQNPKDEALRADYRQFVKDRNEFELAEFQLAAENYPTDLNFRYEIAKRLFELQRFSEAIPMFQQSRSDPKIRTDATMLLGRAFLEAGFIDEAVDTLNALAQDYPLKGDPKSIEMTYFLARTLEEKKDTLAAIKAYSQVAMWDFNYKDVQVRIKKLRNPAA